VRVTIWAIVILPTPFHRPDLKLYQTTRHSETSEQTPPLRAPVVAICPKS
jgi:hypothetical protein